MWPERLSKAKQQLREQGIPPRVGNLIACQRRVAAPSRAVLTGSPLVHRFQRPLKIPQVQIPAGAVEGKVQAVEGQPHLGEIVGDEGESQLLAGGTLPSSWHLLLFLANRVSLALCCPTGWEASLVAQGTSQRSQR